MWWIRAVRDAVGPWSKPAQQRQRSKRGIAQELDTWPLGYQPATIVLEFVAQFVLFVDAPDFAS